MGWGVIGVGFRRFFLFVLNGVVWGGSSSVDFGLGKFWKLWGSFLGKFRGVFLVIFLGMVSGLVSVLWGGRGARDAGCCRFCGLVGGGVVWLGFSGVDSVFVTFGHFWGALSVEIRGCFWVWFWGVGSSDFLVLWGGRGARC